jgi:hypothetical protein
MKCYFINQNIPIVFNRSSSLGVTFKVFNIAELNLDSILFDSVDLSSNGESTYTCTSY